MAEAGLWRWTTRAMLSLPEPMLRVLSRGGLHFQAGRELDPKLRWLARHTPKRSPRSAGEARARLAHTDSLTAGEPDPEVRIETLTVPGAAGPLEARVYHPPQTAPSDPLLVWLPSGGGVAAGLERDAVLCAILARVARCRVLAVQVRLAPEHRLPAQLEDALAAYHWAADALCPEECEFLVGGAGFGGGLAAAVCQALKSRGEAQPVLQLLVAPWVDTVSETQSMTLFADAWPLTVPELNWRLQQLLGPDMHPADPRVSPIKSDDLRGLAPAVVVTAGFDPLVDQGEAYAKRLSDAGVKVLYRCYDRLTHDFHVMTGLAACADLACRETAGLLREGVQRRVELVEA